MLGLSLFGGRTDTERALGKREPQLTLAIFQLLRRVYSARARTHTHTVHGAQLNSEPEPESGARKLNRSGRTFSLARSLDHFFCLLVHFFTLNILNGESELSVNLYTKLRAFSLVWFSFFEKISRFRFHLDRSHPDGNERTKDSNWFKISH